MKKVAILTIPAPDRGTIDKYAKLMINLRDITKAMLEFDGVRVEMVVFGSFDGVRLVCERTDTTDSLVAQYRAGEGKKEPRGWRKYWMRFWTLLATPR